MSYRSGSEGENEQIRKVVSSLRKRHSTLKLNSESWVTIWEKISDHFFPLKSRYLVDDYDPNTVELNDTLLDDLSIRALRILAAGMHGGMTSPSRPWFKLDFPVTFFKPSHESKVWIELAQDTLLRVLARSNFYESIHKVYSQLGGPGTAVILGSRDKDSTIRFNTLTVGQYTLSQNASKRVDTLFRYLDMTADQIVNQFGKENCSAQVVSAYENSSTRDNFFKVVHCITPNVDVIDGKLGYKGKKFLSVYWEEKSKDKPVLSIGGFANQPFAAPRWEIEGGDVYGSSPGMVSLPNVQQLQSMTGSMMKAMHKEIDPPMNADQTLKNASLAPGAINFVGGKESFTPTIAVRSNPQNTSVAIDNVKQSIREGLYNDLFLMLSLGGGDRMTVKEVTERTEEKMIMLGPVVTRLINELLDWVIDWTFTEINEQNLLPPAPEELQGVDLKVNYVSMLAQAQKMAGRVPVEQFMGFIASYGEVFPEMLDALNPDAAADAYATFADTPSMIVRPQTERDDIREEKAKLQQEAMNAQMQNTEADTLNKLSGAEVDGGNMLEGMVN